MIGQFDLNFINWVVHGIDVRHEARTAHEEFRPREEGRYLGDDARVRRETAARDASVCADCGRRLARREPATMTTRNVGSRRTVCWLYVPICRRCAGGHDRTRTRRGSYALYRDPSWVAINCLNCRRPIRVPHGAMLAAQTCCADCERRAEYDRNNARRRVGRYRLVCAGCGERFTSRRHDARFCGGTCRQRAHRRRRNG
jgi:hypothetical protein